MLAALEGLLLKNAVAFTYHRCSIPLESRTEKFETEIAGARPQWRSVISRIARPQLIADGGIGGE